MIFHCQSFCASIIQKRTQGQSALFFIRIRKLKSEAGGSEINNGAIEILDHISHVEPCSFCSKQRIPRPLGLVILIKNMCVLTISINFRV